MVQHDDPPLTPFQHPITPIHRQLPDIIPYLNEATTPVQVDFTVMFIADVKQSAEPNATFRIISHIEEILHV